MPVTFRLRDTPPGLALCLREAAESTIDGDWCITVSQSHVDGQWYLQLDGVASHCRAVLPSATASVGQLEALLRRLSAVAVPAGLLREQHAQPAVRKAS
jgi:hypothetical protein